MEDIKEYIRENIIQEDLTQEQSLLLEALGMDTFLDICELYGGSVIFISKLSTLKYSIIKRKVIENKDIFKAKEMSRIYGISTKTIYNILNKDGK